MPVHLIGAAGAKHNGVDKRFSESNIYQPRLLQVDPQQHVIELGAEAALVVSHPRRKHLDPKAQRG